QGAAAQWRVGWPGSMGHAERGWVIGTGPAGFFVLGSASPERLVGPVGAILAAAGAVRSVGMAGLAALPGGADPLLAGYGLMAPKGALCSHDATGLLCDARRGIASNDPAALAPAALDLSSGVSAASADCPAFGADGRLAAAGIARRGVPSEV